MLRFEDEAMQASMVPSSDEKTVVIKMEQDEVIELDDSSEEDKVNVVDLVQAQKKRKKLSRYTHNHRSGLVQYL